MDEGHGSTPEDLLPLTHLTYHIMLVLKDGAMHGYAIAGAVDELSRGRVKPGTGTFYSAIRRMLEERILDEVERPTSEESRDSRRRYYGLTPFGRRVLDAERRRLTDLLDLGNAGPATVG